MISEGFSLFPGVNPDDTYNETPYEKGYCFVSYLAHLVGDQSKFDAFLQVGARRYQAEVPSHTKPGGGGPERNGTLGRMGWRGGWGEEGVMANRCSRGNEMRGELGPTLAMLGGVPGGAGGWAAPGRGKGPAWAWQR